MTEVGRGFDVTAYLTLLLVATFGLSANQVIKPLGALGRPALLLTAGGALLWLGSRLFSDAFDVPQRQPLRTMLFVYLTYELATIAMAHTRPLSVLEQSGGLRAAITLFCLTGIAALVMDSLDSMDRLDTFMRRLVLATAFMATIGILQFTFGRSFEIRIPGLVYNNDPGTIAMRSVFNRPRGTALHAIEFGVVLGAMLPVALHYALEWTGDRKQRRQMAVAAFTIGLASPLSISRSAIVALVASMSFMAIGWSWRRRGEAAIVTMLALPALWLTIPGLVGTFRSMFSSFGQDPSVQARVSRVPAIIELLNEHPWFGRGSGTMSVEEFLLLDNQLWGTMLSSGIIGLIITLGLFFLAMLMAVTCQFHVGATRETRHLGYAIAAAIFGLVVSFATFDALFFKILQTTLFLLVGAAGALWRITREPPEPAEPSREIVADDSETIHAKATAPA